MLSKGLKGKARPVLYCIDPFNGDAGASDRVIYSRALSTMNKSLKEAFLDEMRPHGVLDVGPSTRGLQLGVCKRFQRSDRSAFHRLEPRVRRRTPGLPTVVSAAQTGRHNRFSRHGIYGKYETRFKSVLSESPARRKLHARLSLRYVDLLAAGSTGRLKRVLNTPGLALLAKRMRHYVAVVLRQE